MHACLPPALLSDRTYLGDCHEHGGQEQKADDTLHGLDCCCCWCLFWSGLLLRVCVCVGGSVIEQNVKGKSKLQQPAQTADVEWAKSDEGIPPPYAPRIILYHASSHNTPSISLPASFRGTFAALLGCCTQSHMATMHSPFNLHEDQTPSSRSVCWVSLKEAPGADRGLWSYLDQAIISIIKKLVASKVSLWTSYPPL